MEVWILHMQPKCWWQEVFQTAVCGKKGKVVLEVEITEDDTDPLLEFRTSITGADDSLRLTAVTIEPQ